MLERQLGEEAPPLPGPRPENARPELPLGPVHGGSRDLVEAPGAFHERLVVVAKDRDFAPLADEVGRRNRGRTVADDVAEAENLVVAVAIDVSEHRRERL